MKQYIKFCLIILFSYMLVSCGDKSQEVNNTLDSLTAEKIPLEQPVSVKVITAKLQNFNRELIANGKLDARKKADLKFRMDGVIMDIFVNEGDRVKLGQVLAKLDNTQQQRTYAQSKLKYKQSVLDYQDMLLRLGYRLNDTAKIDANTKDIARLRSGLSAAEIDMQRSAAELNYTTLSAPFSGKVANLKAKTHSVNSTFEYFCTLIDDTNLEVNFVVLEQELDFIKACKSININLFNDKSKNFFGAIVSINPQVDRSGMISVKAIVKNIGGQLIDGESVLVTAQQGISNQLVIPKKALLEKLGRKVVFTVKEGKAYWNYVDIAYENSKEYVVQSGLHPGDKVIYDGNFNLAHDKPVIIVR